MMLKKEIVKEYIASLKEDSELDYIFPILIERMGYRIISTPKQSKGRSQFGRDIIATKKVKGIPTLFLFELKGFSAHDITDRNLNERDGLIESLRASKYTAFRDASLSGIKECKKQFVFVHNGIIEENARPTLDGFVLEEFPEGNFERWDINILTDLFSKYLFEETLLTDEESYRIFKKVLVLLDAEGNNYNDIVKLIDRQVSEFEKHKKNNDRYIKNFFATLRLIGAMVYYYSIQANNLYPAKFCMDTIVIKLWAWILRTKTEKKKKIITLFKPLVVQQLIVYEEYLNKILKATSFTKGFYSFKASDTEYVLYPLRCFDFLADILYYYYASESFGLKEEDKEIQKKIIQEIITNNSGFKMPMLDTHSIPIQLLFLCFLKEPSDNNIRFVADFLVESIVNMVKRYKMTNMWPEMLGNKKALAKSIYKKSDDYCCESTTLITTLFELLSYLGLKDVYEYFYKEVKASGVDLQISFPINEDYDIEQLLFEHRLYEEMSVYTDFKLPKTLNQFRSEFQKYYNKINYRTDAAGFYYLRILAHIYYQTDLFPDFLGRKYCKSIKDI